jgi:hypothetical protein
MLSSLFDNCVWPALGFIQEHFSLSSFLRKDRETIADDITAGETTVAAPIVVTDACIPVIFHPRLKPVLSRSSHDVLIAALKIRRRTASPKASNALITCARARTHLEVSVCSFSKMVVLKERRRFQERKRLNARILVLQKERRRKEDEERERREEEEGKEEEERKRKEDEERKRREKEEERRRKEDEKKTAAEMRQRLIASRKALKARKEKEKKDVNEDPKEKRKKMLASLLTSGAF